MADAAADMDAEHAASLGRRYLIKFEEDTLRPRPLWIRLIIEFLGTFVLVTVAAGSGVINHYAGGGPISRTAAVIAPGAVVMAMIYAWGPLSGLHINPAVTFAFASRRVFPAGWVVPYWVVHFGGAICAALFLQAMFGDAPRTAAEKAGNLRLLATMVMRVGGSEHARVCRRLDPA